MHSISKVVRLLRPGEAGAMREQANMSGGRGDIHALAQNKAKLAKSECAIKLHTDNSRETSEIKNSQILLKSFQYICMKISCCCSIFMVLFHLITQRVITSSSFLSNQSLINSQQMWEACGWSYWKAATLVCNQ